MNCYFAVLKDMAQTGLKTQIVNANDYYDEKGLLVCGVCGKHRQTINLLPNPTEENPDNKEKVKVVCECECDIERKKRKKANEQTEEDMKYISKLKKASLIDEKFKESHFELFEVTKFNQRNLKLSKRYATGFDEMLKKNQGLLLWGGNGTGKSMLAACIANYLLERKVPVIMTSLVKLLEMIEKDSEKAEDIIERFKRVKLVIFDDLGAERNTPYALEKVFNIIDSRYRSELPMIFTTNLSFDEMQEETDIRYARIYDRIFEVCYPMQFTGPSWRRKIAYQRYNDMEALMMNEGKDE